MFASGRSGRELGLGRHRRTQRPRATRRGVQQRASPARAQTNAEREREQGQGPAGLLRPMGAVLGSRAGGQPRTLACMKAVVAVLTLGVEQVADQCHKATAKQV